MGKNKKRAELASPGQRSFSSDVIEGPDLAMSCRRGDSVGGRKPRRLSIVGRGEARRSGAEDQQVLHKTSWS